MLVIENALVMYAIGLGWIIVVIFLGYPVYFSIVNYYECILTSLLFVWFCSPSWDIDEQVTE